LPSINPDVWVSIKKKIFYWVVHNFIILGIKIMVKKRGEDQLKLFNDACIIQYLPKTYIIFLVFSHTVPTFMTDVQHKNNLQKGLAEKKEGKKIYVYLLQLVEN